MEKDVAQRFPVHEEGDYVIGCMFSVRVSGLVFRVQGLGNTRGAQGLFSSGGALGREREREEERERDRWNHRRVCSLEKVL